MATIRIYCKETIEEALDFHKEITGSDFFECFETSRPSVIRTAERGRASEWMVDLESGKIYFITEAPDKLLILNELTLHSVMDDGPFNEALIFSDKITFLRSRFGRGPGTRAALAKIGKVVTRCGDYLLATDGRREQSTATLTNNRKDSTMADNKHQIELVAKGEPGEKHVVRAKWTSADEWHVLAAFDAWLEVAECVGETVKTLVYDNPVVAIEITKSERGITRREATRVVHQFMEADDADLETEVVEEAMRFFFDVVANSDNWKQGIDAWIPEDDYDETAVAVRYFTSTDLSVSSCPIKEGKNYIHVQADQKGRA
jgi:hypothetical protein